MKIDQLVYFVEAARLESVGKAARSVGISPSAVSTSIALLERELGCALFVRDKQRIYLTARGKALMERASRILRDIDALKEEVQSPALVFEGHYQLACARVLARSTIGRAWAELHARHPKLSVQISTLRSVEIVAKAAVAEIDLGFCLDPTPHPDVDSRRVGTDRYRVAVRSGHPLASVPPKNVAARLGDFPACMPRAVHGLGGYQPHPMLARLDVLPRVDLVYDSYDVVLHRLRRSDAWALLPARLLEQPGARLHFIELPRGEPPIVVAAVWPRRRPLNAVLSELVHAVADELK
jgi:DNA-binding transcriptional LysR family regulator